MKHRSGNQFNQVPLRGYMNLVFTTPVIESSFETGEPIGRWTMNVRLRTMQKTAYLTVRYNGGNEPGDLNPEFPDIAPGTVKGIVLQGDAIPEGNESSDNPHLWGLCNSPNTMDILSVLIVTPSVDPESSDSEDREPTVEFWIEGDSSTDSIDYRVE